MMFVPSLFWQRQALVFRLNSRSPNGRRFRMRVQELGDHVNAVLHEGCAASNGAENAFFAPVLHQKTIDQFTKTGSEQMQETSCAEKCVLCRHDHTAAIHYCQGQAAGEEAALPVPHDGRHG